jgi:hypothetical protein
MEKKELSYEEMSGSSKVYEESEVATDRVPFQNEYEMNRPGSNGLDHSGFKSK